MRALLSILLSTATLAMAQISSDELNLALPTDNDAIFRGGGPAFYQEIVRDFKGVISRPWQGGRYGFVRNPIETTRGIVYSRFHEGIDIRPLRRDTKGEPLDAVRAIAAGTVIHVNLTPRYSNYGRYVVVEHRWDDASYYSLYGHLASVRVQTGASVGRDERLGAMGYTGAGLDQSRAHLHLELNLLLSRRFESWHEHFFKSDPNRHGLYNGLNLTGIDIAKFYQMQRRRPRLSLPQFLSEEETLYKVTMPPSANFDLPARYPWLLRETPAAAPAGWEISFNGAGIPLKVEPAESAVPAPVLSYVKKRRGNYADLTRGVVGGSGDNARLTENGERLMRLLIWPD